MLCPIPGRKTPLFLEGDVVWMKSCGDQPRPDLRLGIQLTGTAPEERERLGSFLEILASKV